MPAIQESAPAGGGGGLSEAEVEAIADASAASAAAALVDSSPAALDTLNELAAALGDDADFAATITTLLAGKQPIDTDLSAIAALSSAANKMPYATGSGTWSLADLTAFARTLLDDADAATALATLGALAKTDGQIFLTPEEFSATAGSPAIGTVGGGRYRAMLFDGTSTETVACCVDLAAHITSAKVDIFWTNAGAGSGGVGWSASLDRAGDGETLAASGGGGTSGIVGASSVAQDVLDIHTLIASVGADPSKLLNVRISRNPADASDTLANDAGLLGVRITPL